MKLEKTVLWGCALIIPCLILMAVGCGDDDKKSDSETDKKQEKETDTNTDESDDTETEADTDSDESDDTETDEDTDSDKSDDTETEAADDSDTVEDEDTDRETEETEATDTDTGGDTDTGDDTDDTDTGDDTGTGKDTDSEMPVDGAAGPGVLPGLVFGTDFTCALTADKDAYCWGANLWGQCGIGVDGEPNKTVEKPTLVVGGHKWKQLSGAVNVVCGVTTENKGYCWGHNRQRQMGVEGDLMSNPTPLLIPELTFDSISVSTDGAFACGVTTDNKGYCWGTSKAMEMERSEPMAIAGGHSFAWIGASVHACGLTTQGAVYCWGDNSSNQLGNADAGKSSKTPVRAAGSAVFTTLRVGSQNCGLDKEGTAHCWGKGGLGGNYEAADMMGYIMYGSADALMVDAGPFVTLDGTCGHVCAIDAAGALTCWGFTGPQKSGRPISSNLQRPGPTPWPAAVVSPAPSTRPEKPFAGRKTMLGHRWPKPKA